MVDENNIEVNDKIGKVVKKSKVKKSKVEKPKSRFVFTLSLIHISEPTRPY